MYGLKKSKSKSKSKSISSEEGLHHPPPSYHWWYIVSSYICVKTICFMLTISMYMENTLCLFWEHACLFQSEEKTFNSGNIVWSVSNTYFYCLVISVFCVFQLCRSAIPGKKKMASYSLKVTRAEREGMKIINPTRQTYINVTDSNACVPFIVAQCREDFDDDSLELVTANGLAIEDSESTRGVSFCTSCFNVQF